MRAQAISRALQEIGGYHRDRVRLARIERRARRREAVRLFTADPAGLLDWLSMPAPRLFCDLDEAIGWLTKRARIQKQRARQGRHDFDGQQLVACVERSAVARYMRRFAGRIWTRRAA